MGPEQVHEESMNGAQQDMEKGMLPEFLPKGFVLLESHPGMSETWAPSELADEFLQVSEGTQSSAGGTNDTVLQKLQRLKATNCVIQNKEVDWDKDKLGVAMQCPDAHPKVSA